MKLNPKSYHSYFGLLIGLRIALLNPFLATAIFVRFLIFHNIKAPGHPFHKVSDAKTAWNYIQAVFLFMMS